MRRQAALMLPAVALAATVVTADYWPQSDPRSGGMRDIMLIYHRADAHYVRDLLPYVAFLDKTQNGKPLDWFYDAFLFMAYGGSPSGELYITGATNLQDWQFWLDVLFEPGRNLSALDATITQVEQTLGPAPQKTPIIVMIPYPSRRQHDFGDVDGDGRTEDFAQEADSLKAIGWFVDETRRRFREADYQHLTLWGFYWMNEGISAADEPIVKRTAELLHDRRMGFHWIPWFNAPGSAKWRELGFDFAVMQPNYAFAHGLYQRTPQRLTDCANLARQRKMGVEIELNPPLVHSQDDRENLLEYLDHGLPEEDGYMAAVHGYYQGSHTIRKLYESGLPLNNELYRALYEFAKGKYARRSQVLSAGLPATVNGRRTALLTDRLTITDPSRPERGLKLTGLSSISLDLGRPCPLGRVSVHVALPKARPSALQRLDVLGDGKLLGSTATLPSSRAGGLTLGWLIVPVSGTASRVEAKPQIAPGAACYVDEIELRMPRGPGYGGRYSLRPAPAFRPLKESGLELTDALVSLLPGDRSRSLGWQGGKAEIELQLTSERFLAGVELMGRAGQPMPDFHGTARLTDRAGREVAVPLAAGQSGRTSATPAERLSMSLTWPAEELLWLDEVVPMPARNLAVGKPYRIEPGFEPTYPDDDNELTDGVLSRGFGDGKTVGWCDISPTVILELPEVRPVEKVRLHCQGGGSAWVHFPRQVSVSTSADGRTWTLQQTVMIADEANGARVIMKWVEVQFPRTPARFVRVWCQAWGWVMLSELEVWDSTRNLARGRSYLLRPSPSSQAKYADNNARLTDGEVSAHSWSEGKTVGWNTERRTITLDLQREETVETLALHLAGGGPAAVWYPSEVRFETSRDGATWSAPSVTREHPPESGQDSSVGYMYVRVGPRRARYVRISVEHHGWAMPDEVEVYPASSGAHED